MGSSCAERHAERLQCDQVQMFSGSLIKVWLGVVPPAPSPPPFVFLSVIDLWEPSGVEVFGLII